MGRLVDADMLFEEMCSRGLVPNKVTFTILINEHCKLLCFCCKFEADFVANRGLCILFLN